MALQSGFTSYIGERLTASDTTITIGTAPTVTTGRMRIYNTSGDQEWISFAGVSGLDLTGCVRGLSQTAIPSTGSSTRALEWAPGSYIELVLMHDEITTNDLAVPGRLATLEDHTDTVWTTTGSANAYILTGVGSAGTYSAIKTILVKANFTNSGPATININSLGVLNILKNDGATALVSNDMIANGVYKLYYNGSAMVLTDQATNTLMITSTGSSNAYVLTPAIPLGAYYVGHTIEWVANFANTGASTVNISGLGAKNIKKYGSTDLVTLDIPNGSVNRIIYDGTQYQLVAPGYINVQEQPTRPQGITGYVNGLATHCYASCATTGFSTTEPFFTVTGSAAAGTNYILRWVKDIYGNVKLTHTVSTAVTGVPSLAVIGNYVYMQYATSLRRYDKADLTNGTGMTISGTALTTSTPIFTNGTDLFQMASAGTAQKYTISGTTATSSTTTAYTSANTTTAYWSDGTSLWGYETNNLYKWAIAGGARTTLASDVYIAGNLFGGGASRLAFGGVIKDAYSPSLLYLFSLNNLNPHPGGGIQPVATF